MKNTYLLIFFLFISLYSFGQNPIHSLQSEKDCLPIEKAHIQNLNTNKITTSDVYGRFQIDMNINDQLKITCIGYTDLYITIDSTLWKENKVLKMKPKSYILEDVAVVPWNTYEKFKSAVLKLKIKSGDGFYYQTDVIPNYFKSNLKSNVHNSGNYLLNFSKGLRYLTRNRAKRKAHKLYRENKTRDYYSQILNEKYNREIIKSVFKSDTINLERFIVYCNKNTHFNYKDSELKIIKALQELYLKFEKDSIKLIK